MSKACITGLSVAVLSLPLTLKAQGQDTDASPSSSHLQSATDPDQELADISLLIEELVDTVMQRALRPPTKPAIYQKAWLGLTIEIGRSELSADYNFSKMSDKEAHQAFMKALEQLAKAPGQRRTLRDLAETAMQSYCRQHDPYTRYIRSDEYHHIQLMEKSKGSHIGMSIHEKDRSYFCYPIPGGPAALAGLKPGDRLIAIDGRAVEGRSLPYVVSLIKGVPGTKVMLRVEHNFGRTETLSVMREEFDMPPILAEKKITGLVLRVRRFNDDVVEATQKALQDLDPSKTLTIDLRGCGGGNLDDAIDFARLFMKEGETVVTLRYRDAPDDVFKAETPPKYEPSAMVLLQDEGTASAAEMVIAALIHSKAQRATSQGPKTFGKGVMTIRRELKGGGALIITNAELIAPQGKTWNETGLLPSLHNKGKILPDSDLP